MSSPYREFRFSEVSLAPDEPGTYAWYHRLNIPDRDVHQCIEAVESAVSDDDRLKLIRSFLDTHLFRSHQEAPYHVRISGALKPKYQGYIDHRNEPSESLVRRLADKPTDLEALRTALRMTVPYFSSPIYIGSARRLRERLMQHVKLISSFQDAQASHTDYLWSQVSLEESDENQRDHSFAYEATVQRRLRPSDLIVSVLALPIVNEIHVGLENILNRINYPLCGRN